MLTTCNKEAKGQLIPHGKVVVGLKIKRSGGRSTFMGVLRRFESDLLAA